MTEAQAQAHLDDMRCPLDGEELEEMVDYDGDEHGVRANVYFECRSPSRHYWHGEYARETRGYWPTSEEAAERYPEVVP